MTLASRLILLSGLYLAACADDAVSPSLTADDDGTGGAAGTGGMGGAAGFDNSGGSPAPPPEMMVDLGYPECPVDMWTFSGDPEEEAAREQHRLEAHGPPDGFWLTTETRVIEAATCPGVEVGQVDTRIDLARFSVRTGPELNRQGQRDMWLTTSDGEELEGLFDIGPSGGSILVSRDSMTLIVRIRFEGDCVSGSVDRWPASDAEECVARARFTGIREQ